MALHPASGPRPTSSKAEIAFYRALMTGLPPGWTAWHSLRLRLGKDWEGEGDFVIAVPNRAIVIIEVVRADADDAADNIVADTFLRFKGLERPYVIVTELDTTDKYDVRMHIALTRATLQAIVIGTDAQIDADPRLRA